MDFREILNLTAKQLCFFGEEGACYDTFWKNIQENIPKVPSYPSIYDIFSDNSNSDNEKDIDLDDPTKKWIWDAIVQLDFFELHIIIQETPLKSEILPDWKKKSFTTIKSQASKILFFPNSLLQENVIFGQGNSLNELHRKIILYIAKSRDKGVAQLDLGNEFKKPPKSLHPIMKKLLKLGDRQPVIYQKSFTYNIFHSFFFPKVNSASVVKDINEKIIKSEEKVTPTFTTDDSKHALVKTLMTSPDKFLTYSTLSRRLGLSYINPVCRRRLKRLINSLAKCGYIKRCRVIQNSSGALQFGVQAIKPYTGALPDSNPIATVGARGIQAGIPIESQIIKLVQDSGSKGLTTVDLRSYLMGMHVKIFSVFSKRLLSPALDGTPAPLSYMWEFQGRTRYMRFFTRFFYDQLENPVELTPVTPVANKKDVPDLGMDIEVISTDLSQLRQISISQRQSTTAIDRKHIVMDILNQKRVSILDISLRNEVQAKLNSLGITTIMDRKTFQNTLELLASESKIGMLQVKVPMLNGLPKDVKIVHLSSFDSNGLEMREFINSLQEQLIYQVKFKKTPKQTESLQIDWGLNEQDYQSDDNSKEEVKADQSGDLPQDNTSLFPSASRKTNPFTEEYFLKAHQRLGLLRTRLLRIKMFHLALVELIGNMTDDFSRQNVFVTTSFFTDLSLHAFLTVIPLREPEAALFEFIKTPDNLNVALKDLPDEIRKNIFSSVNRVRLKVWDLVCPLIALGLMIPISHNNIDSTGRLLLPQSDLICEQYCENFAPYYYLPHNFDMRRIMDSLFSASKHNYSLSSVETAATFWSDLELISTSSDFSPPLSTGLPDSLDKTLNGLLKQMTHKTSWYVDYFFTLEQKKELESYIDLRRGILPINNSVLFHVLSAKFGIWPSLIKNFFFQKLKQFRQRHKKMDPDQQKRFGRLAHATLLTNKKKSNSEKNKPISLPSSTKLSSKPTKVKTIIPSRSDLKPAHRMAGYDAELDDVLLHLYVISKFRLRGKCSWVQINKYLNRPGNEFPRRRLQVILKYLAGQNRVAALFNFWKNLYPDAIASGELQEKVLDKNTGEWQILLPSDPNPVDPYSYLPNFVPIIDYNLEEQLNYFLSRSSGDLPVPAKQSLQIPLPDTVSAIFSNFDISLKPSLCLTTPSSDMFGLPGNPLSSDLIFQSSVSTPNPALGERLLITPHSKVSHCYEELFYDLTSVVSALNLSLRQALTTRFSRLSLDDPSYDSYTQEVIDKDESYELLSESTSEMTVIKKELVKTAIKMVFLVTGNEFDPSQVSDFLIQFPVQHVDQAISELRDQGYLTRSKYKTQSSVTSARTYLNQFLKIPGQKMRLTDRCFLSLTGPVDPQLFHIARLTHQEIISREDPPPVSPFITSGAMMALLSLVSDLKVELHPEYHNLNHTFIRRHSRDRVRAREDVIKCNFGVCIKNLEQSLVSKENSSIVQYDVSSSLKRFADSDAEDLSRAAKRLQPSPVDETLPETLNFGNISCENIVELSNKGVSCNSSKKYLSDNLLDINDKDFVSFQHNLIEKNNFNQTKKKTTFDDLMEKISDPIQKDYAQQVISLIDRCGAVGLPLLLLMMSLPSMTIEQLEPILNSLQNSKPPLIHRVGFDCIRFVGAKHFLKWMVSIQPARKIPKGSDSTTNITDDNAESQASNPIGDYNVPDILLKGQNEPVPMLIIPRPWINFDGATNHQALALYLNAILGHIVRCPGISYATLHRRLMFLVNRGDLYELLNELIKSKSITTRCFIQPPPPDPFSPRTQIIEVAPAQWIGPHHPQGITHYWPTQHAYLSWPLSNTPVAPRQPSGRRQIDLSTQFGTKSETMIFSCE